MKVAVSSTTHKNSTEKIMLWGAEFINVVDEGQTYKFENLRIKAVKKFGGITLGG